MNIAEIRQKYPQYADIPDGELVRGLHKKFYSDIPYGDFLKKIDFREAAPDVTKDMTELDKSLSGMGKSVVDTGRGVKQLFGLMAPEEVDETRALDANLMKTGWGQIGNVVGASAQVLAPGGALARGAKVANSARGANIARELLAPTTFGGAAAQGGAFAATQPVGSDETRLGKVTEGAAGGMVGQGVAKGIGALVRGSAAGATNMGTREAIHKAREAGFKIPPSEMATSGAGKGLAQLTEIFSGRQAVPAKFSAFNQKRFNALVREDIGLGGSGQISDADLANAMKKPLGVYDEAKKISPAARKLVDEWRATNDELRKIYKIQNRNPTLEGDREITRLKAAADKKLQSIENAALKKKSFDMKKRLAAARVELGKIGTVENALNERGDVVGASLFRAKERGVPLSGGMKQVAEFAGAFPRYSQRSTQSGWMTGSPPMVPSLGSGGAFLMGEPVAAAALIAAPYATRSALMSRPIQALAAPQLAPNAAQRFLTPTTERQRMLAEMLRRGAVASGGAALPAAAQD